VHQFVGHHRLEHRLIRRGNHEELAGVGLVVPNDLFGEEVEEQGPEVQGVRQEAEQPVARLHALGLVGRKLLVQLGEHVGPHLVPAPDRGAGRCPKPERGELLDRRHQAVHQARHRLLGLARRPAATGGGEEQEAERRARDATAQGVRTKSRYHAITAGPASQVAAAPMLRKTPKGTSRFWPKNDSGTKTSVPSSAPRNTVSSTPCHPVKAPTIAIILMSPPPIASSLKMRVPTAPTVHSSAKPNAAPRTAWPIPVIPPGTLASSPSPRPPRLNSSG